jgi:hypothetical protein
MIQSVSNYLSMTRQPKPTTAAGLCDACARYGFVHFAGVIGGVQKTPPSVIV